ncbi:MAG: ABC transporter substrate-binding protein, partial [Bacillota bacterium]
MGEGIRRKVWVWGAIAVVLVAALGFIAFRSHAKPEKNLTLATTTSTQDSGLLDVLIPAFEKASGITVKIIAVGTGQSIELGRRGDADVVLVHARRLEDKFVADGQGINRRDVMYTDFVVVGPASDPAKIKGMKDPAAAFAQIATAKAPFISRGDNSGTNVKELDIWGLAKVKPAGTWYLNAGAGMDEALRLAAEKGGYTLT